MAGLSERLPALVAAAQSHGSLPQVAQALSGANYDATAGDGGLFKGMPSTGKGGGVGDGKDFMPFMGGGSGSGTEKEGKSAFTQARGFVNALEQFGRPQMNLYENNLKIGSQYAREVSDLCRM